MEISTPPGWSGRSRTARLAAATAAICGTVVTACGSAQVAERSKAGASAATAPTEPDDTDVAALLPVGPRINIDVNLAVLRSSPWTAAAIEPGAAHERAVKKAALGYDDSTDVDRIEYAVTALDSSRPTLVVAQGRFVAGAVEDAFRARWPGTTVQPWRGSKVLMSDDNALAFVTPRTFASGAPGDVRAVIDRAHGLGDPLDADPGLGPLRRAMGGTGVLDHPAVLAVSTLDAQLRDRLSEVFSVPPAMTQLGVRIDLGHSLMLSALMLVRDRPSAVLLARQISSAARDPKVRVMMAAVGFSPILDNLEIGAEGARVRLTSRLDEDERGAIRQSLQGLVKMLRAR